MDGLSLQAEEKHLFVLIEDAHEDILGGIGSMSDAWNDFITIAGDTSKEIRDAQDAITKMSLSAYLVQVKLNSLKKIYCD